MIPQLAAITAVRTAHAAFDAWGCPTPGRATPRNKASPAAMTTVDLMSAPEARRCSSHDAHRESEDQAQHEKRFDQGE